MCHRLHVHVCVLREYFVSYIFRGLGESFDTCIV